MNESRYTIQLEWDADDRLFVAFVSELPGCMAHGKTRAAALKAAERAIKLWVECAREDGFPIPEPGALSRT